MLNIMRIVLSLCFVTGLFACQRKVIITRIDGKLSEKYQVLRKTNTKDGFYYSYHSNRRVAIEQTYKADKPHGFMRTYFEDGSLESVKQLKNGIFQGPFYYYYSNGILMQKGFYQANEIYGDLFSYFSNGQLKEVVSIQHNNEFGPFREYNEQGVLVAEGNYVSETDRTALEHGLLYIYDGTTQKLLRKMRCWQGHCCTIWNQENGYVPPSSDLCREILLKKEINLGAIPTGSK